MEQSIEQFMQDFFQRDKKDKVIRYHYLNAYVKKGQIVFAGSSLMEQFPIYEFMQDFDIPKVIYNRGVGGYTTTEMMETLEECIFELEPSRLFLNIGTNDFNTPDYREEELIERYGMILTKIRERLPETEIYLMAYYPVNELAADNPRMQEVFKQRTNAKLLSANKAVEKLAAEYGAKYIDVNTGLYDAYGRLKAEYTIEGMHMYANGYRAVLTELLPYILEE